MSPDPSEPDVSSAQIKVFSWTVETVEPDRKWSFNRWWLGVSRASSADQGWENRVSRAGKQFHGRRHQSTISMSLAVCCALISFRLRVCRARQHHDRGWMYG